MTEFILQYWLQAFFGLVVFMMVGVYKKLKKIILDFVHGVHKRLDKIDKDLENSKYSDKVILEDRLLQAHRYYTEKRYCTAIERQLVNKLHKAYKKAGGNGAMDEIIKDICDLPFQPPKNNTGGNNDGI
jgi:hypothetical protein